MRYMRRRDTVVEPGFGLMEGDFSHRVARVDRVRRRFYIAAGLLSGWRSMRSYRWDTERSCWVLAEK